MWRYLKTFILKGFFLGKTETGSDVSVTEGTGAEKKYELEVRARDIRRGPERQRVKIKPTYCDSFAVTWTAFGEYRGELTKSWTELVVLLRVLSRECDCCGTELWAWATREGRHSSRLPGWRLCECLSPSKES